MAQYRREMLLGTRKQYPAALKWRDWMIALRDPCAKFRDRVEAAIGKEDQMYLIACGEALQFRRRQIAAGNTHE